MLSKRLLGRSISAIGISCANAELTDSVNKWRRRNLTEEQLKYLFTAAVNFRMRIDREIDLIPACWH